MTSATVTPYAERRGASSGSAEVCRRYPSPEMVQLRVKATPTITTATSTAGVTLPPSSWTSACSDTEVAAAPPESTSCVSLKLRWGIQATELRRLYEMHKNAYPISYTASYYQWLLNHDACMALVALATQETYREWVERWGKRDHHTPQTVATPAECPASSSSPSPASTIPPFPPPVSQCRATSEMLQECEQVESVIAEQERIAMNKDADSMHKDTKSLSNSDDSDSAAHTVVVGLIIGQIAYARHDAGHLLSNPTAYIGSFAVDPPFQACGVGSALLQRFITYVTQQRPVYAQDYLHYDKRKLITLLAKAQVTKRKAEMTKSLDTTSASAAGGACEENGSGSRHRDGLSDGPLSPSASSAAPLQSSSPAQAHSSIFQSLLTYLPEVQGWIEDRQERRRLRSCGLTEEEVDAQRSRDQLEHDVLTDEEADEVRREACHFLVQTGVRDVWLHCLPGNVKATTFYSHRGFALHRVLKAYYDIGGVAYDAFLLHYLSGSDEPAALPGASAEVSSTVAADTLSEMNHVVNLLERRAAPEGDTVHSDGTISLTAATPAFVSASPSSLTGLRRRRGAPLIEGGRSLTTASALSEADGASISTPQTTTHATAPGTPSKQISLPTASWLSPRTYPMVADIILCTAEKGQEEWRRRTEPKDSGDEAQQRLGWWEMAREVALVMNAFGLLSAVLWVAYNAVVEGKVL
ncbi:hypothetical protein, conserved [Leishmania tarentolae]|uniref:N-alpha-acetyltransferase 60 n=1 Tax=Leishmania tarentolae TaxID=5689 RepID=A0A640KFK2_LEITA|nr:hypothetical protein, conserved [Leishmania tarentolae]